MSHTHGAAEKIYLAVTSWFDFEAKDQREIALRRVAGSAPLLVIRDCPLSAPLRGQDFCRCARGRGARWWWQHDTRILPALAAHLDGCRRCDNEGRRLYDGGVDVEGRLEIVPINPKPAPWPNHLQRGA